MPDSRFIPAFRLTTLAAALAAAGCAGLPGTAGAPATPSAAATAPARPAAAAPAPAAGATAAATPPAARPGSPPAPAAAPPVPGQPQPFATVIRDAKRIDGGLFTVWQKDEKFWLELDAKDFGRALFLSPKLASGIGEAGIFAGTMLKPQVVELRRVHNQVQLIALNTASFARPGTPEARNVAQGYSPSLLASTPVASQPHPDRKTVLVDATALFVNDMLGLGATLARSFRQNYALDRGNSAILRVRSKPALLAIEANNHYATAVVAQPTPGAPSTAPQPSTPRHLPDARSLFLGVHYSLAPLPEQPMRPRLADGRIGHFPHSLYDWSDDLARTPRVHHVARWRLEKKDPAAEKSEPVKPITYVIDRNVPLKYRESIRAGILEWNKAFERIGFVGAIKVEVQPDDADWDTLDFGVASVRWLTNANPQYGAIGPRHVDPRTGEILDADMLFESLSSRNIRSWRARLYTDASAWNPILQIGRPPAEAAHDMLRCEHGDHAAEQLGYALDVLTSAGDLDPGSPEAEAFVQAYMKDVTMHEVGHTLGLRHNFRASRVYSPAQLADPEFTRANALTGSVMEYAAVNLPSPGEKRPAPFQTTLGPYDHWAIEYAYKTIAPEQEAAELQRIASRSYEPELAYGTDEDNFFGVDPESLHFDLGSDPMGFAKKRFEIAQEMFRRQEARTFAPGAKYSALRRSLQRAVVDAGIAAGTLLRQIGGVRTLRDHPGTGRDPLQPVPAADQRAALDLIARYALAADTFVVSPELARRLAPDYLEVADQVFTGNFNSIQTYYPLAQTLHAMRTALLNQLMSDTLAVRLLDSERKVRQPDEALRLSELYRRLEAEIWSELAGKVIEIPAARRELQREHANRLAALVLRPSAYSRADARALVRGQATDLAARLEAAVKRPGTSDETRAHLRDSADALRAAIAATLQRAGT